MTPIFKTIHGSQLFGTNTPNSDTDYKGVFLESLDNIILGKDSKQQVITTSKDGVRNSKDDVDTDLKELRTFIRDCLQGQTYAIEMLFAPRDKWVESSEIWEFIIANRDKLVTNDMRAFIGYCRGQAQKYSLRGDRLLALVAVIDFLKQKDRNLNLCQVQLELLDLECLRQSTDLVKVDSYIQRNGYQDNYLSVLGIKLQTNKRNTTSIRS